MHPAEASAEPVRSQLEKILASPEFLRNERLSKFLRFVVEQQLAGKAAELKESLVGIEVFGRTPGFDPRQARWSARKPPNCVPVCRSITPAKALGTRS
jgi:hypothetical protein